MNICSRATTLCDVYVNKYLLIDPILLSFQSWLTWNQLTGISQSERVYFSST